MFLLLPAVLFSCTPKQRGADGVTEIKTYKKISQDSTLRKENPLKVQEKAKAKAKSKKKTSKKRKRK